MLVGGYTNQAVSDIEIIDLSSPNMTCRKPADLPTTLSYGVGAYIHNSVMICGGGTAGTEPVSSDCYTYDADADSWSKSLTAKLNQARWANICLNVSRPVTNVETR